MTLVWGVTPMLIGTASDTDSLIQSVIDAASAGGMLHEGDTVVISAGVPMGQSGTTNLIKVESVSTILAHGSGLGQKVVTGRAVLGTTASIAQAKTGPGDILVAPATDRDYVPAMEQCAGLVVEQGGLTSHAAIAALSMGIPVVVGVQRALQLIEDGQVITIDPKRGLIVAGRPKSL
jgi:pyruvate kinase